MRDSAVRPAPAKAPSPGLGFERVHLIAGSTYRDCSTVVVVPTRGLPHQPSISPKFLMHFQGMIAPMNQKRAVLFACGHEVGRAYDEMIAMVLRDPGLSSWKHVLTVEDDNLVPADAHVRLLETIEAGKYDAVSGIYFTKGDVNMPMAYGCPEEFRRTGVLDFRPRDVREALSAGQVMEVSGIAMGCALWRLDLFREVPPPWFVTVADVVPGQGPRIMTQDLSFCERATRVGKRFAVDMRVRVGHMDVQTGVVY